MTDIYSKSNTISIVVIACICVLVPIIFVVADVLRSINGIMCATTSILVDPVSSSFIPIA